MSNPTIVEAIVANRFQRDADHINTSTTISGRTFESIPLGLGQTVVQREVLAAGEYGEMEIKSQESFGLSVSVGEHYVVRDGRILYDPWFRIGEERPVSLLRQGIIAARVLFGRVDNWENEASLVIYEDEE